VRSVAVATGMFSSDQLRDADLVLDTLEDAERLLKWMDGEER
jgi:hypothetical protein